VTEMEKCWPELFRKRYSPDK